MASDKKPTIYDMTSRDQFVADEVRYSAFSRATACVMKFGTSVARA